jgi:hypothetical protein
LQEKKKQYTFFVCSPSNNMSQRFNQRQGDGYYGIDLPKADRGYMNRTVNSANLFTANQDAQRAERVRMREAEAALQMRGATLHQHENIGAQRRFAATIADYRARGLKNVSEQHVVTRSSIYNYKNRPGVVPVLNGRPGTEQKPLGIARRGSSQLIVEQEREIFALPPAEAPRLGQELRSCVVRANPEKPCTLMVLPMPMSETYQVVFGPSDGSAPVRHITTTPNAPTILDGLHGRTYTVVVGTSAHMDAQRVDARREYVVKEVTPYCLRGIEDH